MQPRIGILVVAYNAAGTLAKVLDRIPAEFRAADRRHPRQRRPQRRLDLPGRARLPADRPPTLPLEVVRNPHNLGYGGNQKVGYRWAIERGLDIVVMLHGDGQYAPEKLPDMVAPLERGEADAVFGSRMLDAQGAARQGGMPLYKYVGNKMLTTLENAMAGADLSEWHSGYRAYSVDALQDAAVRAATTTTSTSTRQIIMQLLEAGKRIVKEIPIPTFYGDEICYVERAQVRPPGHPRRHRGTGPTRWASAPASWPSPATPTRPRSPTPARTAASCAWLLDRPPARVLDLGCGDGFVAEQLRAAGHHVVGVDLAAAEGVEGAGRRLHRRPTSTQGCRPRSSRRPVRRRRRRRRDRARAPARASCSTSSHGVLAPGGVAGGLDPQLRPLVPAASGCSPAGSTTTAAASSTPPTCASSPSAASSAWSRERGWRVARRA